jgi:hypothetical protein
MKVTGSSQFVRPPRTPSSVLGEAEPPKTISQPVGVPGGMGTTMEIQKQVASPAACLMPPSKRHPNLFDPPTSTMWATSPHDGPLLLPTGKFMYVH